MCIRKKARLLMADDKLVGFEVETNPARRRAGISHSGIATAESGPERVTAAHHDRHLAPHALVVTFDAECANPYGCALLARAYPAWWEKWMPGGAKRTLRLRMIKDAYIGDIFWYPQQSVRANARRPRGELARHVARDRPVAGQRRRDDAAAHSRLAGEQAARLHAAARRFRLHANLPVEEGPRPGNLEGPRSAAGNHPGQQLRQRLQRPLDSVRRGPLCRASRAGRSDPRGRSRHPPADRLAQLRPRTAIRHPAQVAGRDICREVRHRLVLSREQFQ